MASIQRYKAADLHLGPLGYPVNYNAIAARSYSFNAYVGCRWLFTCCIKRSINRIVIENHYQLALV